MIEKHELPILEYDPGSEEVIKPNHSAEQLRLPEKCVYAFLGQAVDDYAFEADAVVAETFETITRNYPVYIVKQAADSLANVLEHDERDWGRNSLRKALELCIAVLQAI